MTAPVPFKYVGPHDAVDLAGFGVVERGDPVDVPAELVEHFDSRDDFERAQPAAAKRAASKRAAKKAPAKKAAAKAAAPADNPTGDAGEKQEG